MKAGREQLNYVSEERRCTGVVGGLNLYGLYYMYASGIIMCDT